MEPFNDDFRDLLIALSDADARFMVVGGYAVAVHGRPRATKDLDVWVEPTLENASRVLRWRIKRANQRERRDAKSLISWGLREVSLIGVTTA